MASFSIKEERFYPRRKKTPSFSSSLLDAICHSIDESQQNKDQFFQNARIPLGCDAEEDITRHRRQIMVDKWMEIQTRSARSRRYCLNSDSSSSADSSLFSYSETECSAASRSTPKLQFHDPNKSKRQMLYETEATPKHERKLFMRTKSKALKIYGDLKKVKQPISPGAKITNFLNSLFFNSRNLKKNQGMEDLSVSGMRSRSVQDSSTNKPKKSVKFCPVSVIVDDQDYCSSLRTMPKISSQYIKKNIDSFRDYRVKQSDEYQQQFIGCYEHESNDDEESCTSSDLFEIENIGIVGMDSSREEELPVFGTTILKMNQAIATGMVV